jgi:stearoyl-CoA desaturase (Delta-9 desaturase)
MSGEPHQPGEDEMRGLLPFKMFSQFPFRRVNWLISSFLIGTVVLSVTAVPLYLYFFGIDWFQIVLFFFMLFACGFSITLGYHRLFSHLAFRANWLVRLFVVVFGAGAFEQSRILTGAKGGNHNTQRSQRPRRQSTTKDRKTEEE